MLKQNHGIKETKNVGYFSKFPVSALRKESLIGPKLS
jgi:hypothetical protein